MLRERMVPVPVFRFLENGSGGSGSAFGSCENGSDGSGFRFRFGSWATLLSGVRASLRWHCRDDGAVAGEVHRGIAQSREGRVRDLDVF